MDKISKFDRQLELTCESSFFNGKVAAFMLCSLGLMIMMIPVELSVVLTGVVWLGCLLCMIGVSLYMQFYLRVREDGRSISIYKKLTYMPVAKAEIRKARIRYLNHFCIRLCAIVFLIQQLTSFLNHSFGIVSLLSAAVWAALIWITGIFTVLWP